MGPSDAFVGRGDESEQLVRSLGVGESVLLTGDAGVGKTRLLDEVSHRLGQRGLQVFVGRCLPMASELPFLPVTDMLSALYGSDAGSCVERLLEKCPAYVRTDLARLLPELGSAETALSEGWQQRRLFHALATFWRTLAQREPVVLIVEDAHWSDPSSRDFLTYLATHSSPRLALVVSGRTEVIDHDDTHSWWMQLARLPGLTQLHLTPLPLAGVRQLAETILHTVLDETSALELWQRTEGNPFFVEQLLAAGTYQRGAMINDDLARLLRSRTRTISELARTVLRVLSLAARPLTETELSVVTGHPVAAVRGALHELVVARLAHRHDNAEVTPQHALLAEAVASELLSGERIDLHGSIATVLADRLEPGLAGEIASHWAGAHRPAEELVARTEAAVYAEGVFAFADAAAHWERCVDLVDTLGRPGEELARFALRGMVAWEAAGRSDQAKKLGERGIAAGGVGDPLTYATLLARQAFLTHLVDRERGLSDLTDAVDLFDKLPVSAEQVHSLHMLYRLYCGQGRHQDGLPFLRKAVELGGQTAAAAAPLVRALTNVAYEELRSGHVDQGLATLERAHQLGEPLGDPYTYGWLAASETDAYLKLNKLELAAQIGQEYLDRFQAYGYGDSFSAALCTANATEALLGLGRIDDAAALIVLPTDQTELTPDRWVMHQLRCDVDLACGRLSDAAARLQLIVELNLDRSVEYDAELGRTRAELALWQDEPLTAIELLRPILEGLVGTDEERLAGPLLVLAMRGCADLAEHAMGIRDPELGAAVTTHTRALTHILGSLTINPFLPHPYYVTAKGDAADWRAELGRASGADHESIWAEAATQWAAMSRPTRAAYARLRQSLPLLIQGRRSEATTLLRTAIADAGQHQPLQIRIRTLAHSGRIDLSWTQEPHEPAQEQALPFGLTPRELDVLRLLVQGFTNNQIGSRLFMSPKTASVHVTAILRKLQATNRVHAATIAQHAGIKLDI